MLRGTSFPFSPPFEINERLSELLDLYMARYSHISKDLNGIILGKIET